MPPSASRTLLVGEELKHIKGVTACSDSEALAVVCGCTSHDASRNIAYDSGGCLPCVHQDCSYYIQNFVETILESYHVAY
jgi:hypothetical protein